METLILLSGILTGLGVGASLALAWHIKVTANVVAKVHEAYKMGLAVSTTSDPVAASRMLWNQVRRETLPTPPVQVPSLPESAVPGFTAHSPVYHEASGMDGIFDLTGGRSFPIETGVP